ncbi:class I SAM-dependent methyltransferase [Inediibacterium massiliense]|uniref:class I SAM-dependent methyltransferase n=1 Tax=Inediibacterium massiliense TaxID=1658111 RepID=UPI0006B69CF2|nr:class I SAM-dependent methyltransferase [Inediibacterium massiliense]
MINKILFYLRLGYKLIKKDVVNREDYRGEYDKVSDTYHYWLKEMGRYTDHIIHSKYIETDKELKILDFACGTGYITKNLLTKSTKCKITSVDQSSKMLEKLLDISDDRVVVVQSDGIEFLKTSNEKFDVIFFGWALSYFDHHELFKLFNRVLKPEGIFAIITNVDGTLDKIEKIFLNVMNENQKEVVKPMDIKLNLPQGKKGLAKWCNLYGFKVLEVEEEEVFFNFKEPEELLQWLNITGAAAGTRKIFRNYDEMKPFIIEKIKKEKYKNGVYEINHKFAYGIFRKE